MISLVLEGNELDTYISREVPVPKGDEAKSLHKKIVNDSINDHLIPQGSSLNTPKEMFWFLDQDIWREEHKSKDDFKKPVEECEDPECRNHIVIL